MKIFILVACSLAVTSASYHHDEHIPVITKKGVPLETPEVRAAKAKHFRALEAAEHRNYGYGHHEDDGHNRYDDDGHNTYHGDDGQRYHGPKHIPIITKEGVPLETHAVRAAKAEHFAAVANAEGHYGGYGYGHRETAHKYLGPKHIPHITKQGVPLDTPEVRAARAKHFNAYHAAQYGYGRYGDDGDDTGYYNNNLYSGYNRNSIGYASGYDHHEHYPIIGKNGVPLDTPEVQAAKRHHFAAYEKAASRSHYGGYHNSYAPDYDRGYDNGYQNSYKRSSRYHHHH